MVTKAGSYEYFDPRDGSGAGAANFSWTAALAIDLFKVGGYQAAKPASTDS